MLTATEQTGRISANAFLAAPKIMVGSLAINHIIGRSNIQFREPKDIDYLLCGQDKKYFGTTSDGRKIDAHGIPEEIFEYIRGTCHTEFDGSLPYDLPCLETLYTLKVSHAAFDIHWEKTMWDINWFQEQKYKVDEKLYDMLYPFWLEIHAHKKNLVNLNRTNEDFFLDNVKRVYEHDDLHMCIKYNAIPMYKVLKHDQTKAMIAKDLWDKCRYHEKTQLCREEIYVTALERFYIPSEGKMPPLICYRKAIKKLVTSMSKGWFPRFIIEHYNDIKNPDKDYVDDFNVALAKGNIRTVK